MAARICAALAMRAASSGCETEVGKAGDAGAQHFSDREARAIAHEIHAGALRKLSGQRRGAARPPAVPRRAAARGLARVCAFTRPGKSAWLLAQHMGCAARSCSRSSVAGPSGADAPRVHGHGITLRVQPLAGVHRQQPARLDQEVRGFSHRTGASGTVKTAARQYIDAVPSGRAPCRWRAGVRRWRPEEQRLGVRMRALFRPPTGRDECSQFNG